MNFGLFQGHPRLVSVLATMYSPLLGHHIDGNTEITVTLGAMQALFMTCTGLLKPGDEVSLGLINSLRK